MTCWDIINIFFSVVLFWVAMRLYSQCETADLKSSHSKSDLLPDIR